MRNLITLSTLLLLAVWGCAPTGDSGGETTADATPAPAEDDAAAVRALNESWDPTFMSADADAMAALFTEDAVRLAADGPLQRGRDAIRAAFAEQFATSTSDSSNPLDSLGVAGDWAWARGTYDDETTDKESGEVTEDHGKWLTIARKTADGWKFEVDSWNGDGPGDAGEALTEVSLPPAEDQVNGDAAEVEAVRALISGWEAATEALDANAIAALYADDAIELPDRAPALMGRDAIRANQEGIQPAAQESSLTFDAIEVDGDQAWARGHWGISQTTADGATVHDQGKWLNVLRRGDDGWKITITLWNREAPPPAAP